MWGPTKKLGPTGQTVFSLLDTNRKQTKERINKDIVIFTEEVVQLAINSSTTSSSSLNPSLAFKSTHF